MDVIRRSNSSAHTQMLVALVSLLGLLAGAFYAAVELSEYNWDPVGVISIGEDDPVIVDFDFSLTR